MDRCSQCNELHDNWPDKNKGFFCQECWEMFCDKKWWEQVLILNSLQNELIDLAVNKDQTKP